jgi:hypothetical protein
MGEKERAFKGKGKADANPSPVLILSQHAIGIGNNHSFST